MVIKTIISCSTLIPKSPQFSFLKRFLQPRFFHSHPFSPSSSTSTTTLSNPPFFHSPTRITHLLTSPFCSSSSNEPRKRNTLVNFSLSDTESDSEDGKLIEKKLDKSKLPPPYDPFSKKPIIEEPEDPKNLQEVFHKIRSDGLMNSAVKMFDGLSKDGLTHEALELFTQIKDKGEMPDVVAHTAVIEAYANAGQAKEVLKVFMRMLATGVLPNAYTYSVLVKGLVESGELSFVKEAKKYVVEMVEKRGIKPNAGVCVGVYEGLVKVGLEEEGKIVLQMVKSKGFVPEEGKVREALKNKRGPVFRTVMNVFYDK